MKMKKEDFLKLSDQENKNIVQGVPKDNWDIRVKFISHYITLK